MTVMIGQDCAQIFTNFLLKIWSDGGLQMSPFFVDALPHAHYEVFDHSPTRLNWGEFYLLYQGL